MRQPGISKQEKIKRSLIGALIFAVLSSPQAFALVSKVLGPVGHKVATPAGSPTTLGLFVHAAVFVAILVGLMSIKK